ncbi:hypothetical protein [Streptosporangium pseudovulgare]|uniref:Uncharacterized protein n=1 Tax=Streptosporangium pseudovulgare TaxID=35765 RepID=A0ABQ2RE16_9ACTN|nr:hypothetical protein [Streptosporangium pseudovulgare]GGQ27235.1 hypothetical protein GCM10010140_66730 [Streptosporangium pseudovulgare]
MRIRPALSAVAVAGGLVLLCPPAHAAASAARQTVSEVRQAASGVRQAAVLATDVVSYQCEVTPSGEKQDVRVRVEMEMPSDARVDVQTTIRWRGTYADETGVLRVPAVGLPAGTRLYAYASISGIENFTSATGTDDLATLRAGQVLQLPEGWVSLRTTPRNAGTATVKPATINFGTDSDKQLIHCKVLNADALKTYSLPVASGNGQPADPTSTPDPTDSTPVSPTPDPTPEPTPTVTVTTVDQSADSDPETPEPAVVTEEAVEPVGGVNETPFGAAATGGGGEAGPDARTFVVAGFLLTLTAGIGLRSRRRGVLDG